MEDRLHRKGHRPLKTEKVVIDGDVDEVIQKALEEKADLVVQPVVQIFNGIYTVQSKQTGDHRTFRVRTQREDARFAPGERILSVLTGPDNSSDYTGLGFVKNDGTIQIWKRHKGGRFEEIAEVFRLAVIEEDDRFVVELAGRCCICNRMLTHPISIRTGIGPVCAGRDNAATMLGVDPDKLKAIRIIAELQGIM